MAWGRRIVTRPTPGFEALTFRRGGERVQVPLPGRAAT